MTKNFSLPKSHPVLCELTIDVMDWYRFQRLNEDAVGSKIIKHNEPEDGRMTVYVACAANDVKEALEDGWH
jgi:hypothetical protein